MACLKNPPPTPVCATPPRSRPLPPLSSNEALALWTQASHLFHHLNWTSAALLIAQILRRTSTDSTPHISRAKLWANLGVVRFHLGDYALALKAIEEALDEVSASMGLKASAVEDEDALDGAAMRNRLGRARSATTTVADFIRAGAARIAPSKKNGTPVSELAGASGTNVERDTRPPPHIGKAATVTNSITTMGRFIRAGAVWSVTNSGAVDRAQISARRGTKTLTRERSIRAPQATTSEEPEVDSVEGAEAAGPATTAEAGRAAKRKFWSHQASKQTRANEEHGVPPDAPRPLAQPQEPLPFPPETPLLFFLAGLVAYHLPTTPHSPINYFRVAHAYFKRCLWALSLLSHTTTTPNPPLNTSRTLSPTTTKRRMIMTTPGNTTPRRKWKTSRQKGMPTASTSRPSASRSCSHAAASSPTR
ncbi:hypothetical protein BC567DRAFT_15695 [Phyllosticta citribraziliensis]